MNKLLSRKFIIGVLATVALTAVCLAGRIDGAQFLTGLLAVVAMFTAANLKEKKDALAAGVKPETTS